MLQLDDCRLSSALVTYLSVTLLLPADFTQEEDNVLTRDCRFLGNTIASSKVGNRQPLANNDREIVECKTHFWTRKSRLQ